MWYPERARAASSDSSTTTPAPSPRPYPSADASNAFERPSCDKNRPMRKERERSIVSISLHRFLFSFSAVLFSIWTFHTFAQHYREKGVCDHVYTRHNGAIAFSGEYLLASDVQRNERRRASRICIKYIKTNFIIIYFFYWKIKLYALQILY